METKSVAVVGASTDRSKYGNKAVRAYARQGWTVYPIHPKAEQIEGVKAYARLSDLPDRPQRVSLYLPPDIGLKVLPEIAAAQPKEFFINPGAESEALVAESRRLGLDPLLACSIIEIGVTPSQFPDS